jgi:hypothetical protein
MSGPYSFDEARAAAGRASRAQEAAEDFIRSSARDAAIAEEAYRVELAKKITELRASGEAATLARDLARGDRVVAKLKREAMIADGVRDAAVQAAWRRAADRRDTERFCEWSMRRELAEGYGRTPEHAATGTYGATRAA